MKMVIGGACQGKKEYAKRQYSGIEWIDGKNCPLEDIFLCGGIVEFQEYILRWMSVHAEKKAEELAADIIERNPDLVVVSNEIGYGLVPVDAFERTYREGTGRICTMLAAYAERVDRVVCGIGTRIK